MSVIILFFCKNNLKFHLTPFFNVQQCCNFLNIFLCLHQLWILLFHIISSMILTFFCGLKNHSLSIIFWTFISQQQITLMCSFWFHSKKKNLLYQTIILFFINLTKLSRFLKHNKKIRLVWTQIREKRWLPRKI